MTRILIAAIVMGGLGVIFVLKVIGDEDTEINICWACLLLFMSVIMVSLRIYAYNMSIHCCDVFLPSLLCFDSLFLMHIVCTALLHLHSERIQGPKHSRGDGKV